MGADLIAAWIPDFERTEERRAAFLEQVRGCKELPAIVEEIIGEEMRHDEAVDRMADAFDCEPDGRRDCTWFRFPGMDYGVSITAGMSWGDTPTDCYDNFALLGYLDAPFEMMMDWAKEDIACQKV